MIDSAFPRVTVANTGDRVTLSGNVALEGTVGTAGGPRTQFRFGLFSDDDDGDDVVGRVLHEQLQRQLNARRNARPQTRRQHVRLPVHHRPELARFDAGQRRQLHRRHVHVQHYAGAGRGRAARLRHAERDDERLHPVPRRRRHDRLHPGDVHRQLRRLPAGRQPRRRPRLVLEHRRHVRLSWSPRRRAPGRLRTGPAVAASVLIAPVPAELGQPERLVRAGGEAAVGGLVGRAHRRRGGVEEVCLAAGRGRPAPPPGRPPAPPRGDERTTVRTWRSRASPALARPARRPVPRSPGGRTPAAAPCRATAPPASRRTGRAGRRWPGPAPGWLVLAIIKSPAVAARVASPSSWLRNADTLTRSGIIQLRSSMTRIAGADSTCCFTTAVKSSSSMPCRCAARAPPRPAACSASERMMLSCRCRAGRVHQHAAAIRHAHLPVKRKALERRSRPPRSRGGGGSPRQDQVVQPARVGRMPRSARRSC